MWHAREGTQGKGCQMRHTASKRAGVDYRAKLCWRRIGRVAAAGGSSLPVEIIHDFKSRFGVQIQEGYGLSETSPVATFAPLGHEPRPGSIGTPIWGVECKLIDADWNEITDVDEVGEIAIGVTQSQRYFMSAGAQP